MVALIAAGAEVDPDKWRTEFDESLTAEPAAQQLSGRGQAVLALMQGG